MFKSKMVSYCMLITAVLLLLTSCFPTQNSSSLQHSSSSSTPVSSDAMTEGNQLNQYLEQKGSTSLDTVGNDEIWITTEGGHIRGIYNDNVLVFMNVTLFGEMGKIQHDYYFGSDCLTYIKTEIHYSQPMNMQDENFHISEINEERYVLFNGTLYSYSLDSNVMTEMSGTDKDSLVIDLEKYLEMMENNI